MTEWMDSYFERGYLARWALRAPSRETEQEVEGLWASLALTSGASLLDIGCGHGRYAVAFRQRRAEITGLDLSAALLRRAQQVAGECGVYVNWVRGEMRQLPFREAHFRAALLFDAFGFFEQEVEDDLVLHELLRVLAPGGRAALKVVNAEPILTDFRATDRVERDGTIVEISRTLTDSPIRLVEKVLIRGLQGTGSYERRQRLYRGTELCATLKRAGFVVLGLFSSFSGAPFDAASSGTMVVIVERS
jgi:SAM-dependent methyltransferase